MGRKRVEQMEFGCCSAVGCAGLLRVRVAAKKVPGVRFFLPTTPAT